MNETYDNKIFTALEEEMVLTESMKIRLKQICIYADTAGIDMEKIIRELRENGSLPAGDKNSSKRVLSEIYDNVACSF